jgi:deferrochelatase/peroxidase EfeB
MDVTRRRLLQGGLVTGAVTALGACADGDPVRGANRLAPTAARTDRYLRFEDEHQAGILDASDEYALLAAFRSTADGTETLAAIFRRGLSFSRGFDADGHLDQGLAFVSFQRHMSQFLNTRARLKGEPLEEYIEPQGGGFYFALPGVANPRGWLGQDLFG